MDKNKRVKTTTSLWQRVWLILFGLFLTLVILEIGMRLSGIAWLSLQEYSNRLSLRKKGVYLIMCLGESTTGCGGNDAYPYQLEEVLNNSGIGVRFSVVNKGRPAKDTTEIVENLDKNINQFHPDMVITMMGINDDWDLAEQKERKKYWFSNMRLYKLAGRIFSSIHKGRNLDLFPERINSCEIPGGLNLSELSSQNRGNDNFRRSPASDKHMRAGKVFYDQGNYEMAAREFKKSIVLDYRDSLAYESLAASLVFDGKDNEALEVYNNQRKISPGNAMLYFDMAKVHLYRGEYDKAEISFLRALQLGKVQRYRDFGREKEAAYGALLFLSEIKNDEKSKSMYSKILDGLEEKYINAVTRDNYVKIRKTLQQRGIKLVMVQYAMRKLEYLKKMVDSSSDIIFVDNERLFKDAVMKSGFREYFADMWAGDFGHCTRKGNRLLAENIANTVLKEVFHK
ncbi:MAG: hypothetical protein WC510_08305 [Candidatus Omnitrophota bacterium]